LDNETGEEKWSCYRKSSINSKQPAGIYVNLGDKKLYVPQIGFSSDGGGNLPQVRNISFDDILRDFQKRPQGLPVRSDRWTETKNYYSHSNLFGLYNGAYVFIRYIRCYNEKNLAIVYLGKTTTENKEPFEDPTKRMGNYELECKLERSDCTLYYYSLNGEGTKETYEAALVSKGYGDTGKPYITDGMTHPTKPSAAEFHNKHPYVDLGLPSGTKWAICNIGAEKPEQEGKRFRWGETIPYNANSNDEYKWNNHYNEVPYSKYNKIDEKKELELEDDAAYINWGDGWQTPSKEQMEELISNCTIKEGSLNNNTGLFFISKNNGKSIFIRNYSTDIGYEILTRSLDDKGYVNYLHTNRKQLRWVGAREKEKQIRPVLASEGASRISHGSNQQTSRYSQSSASRSTYGSNKQKDYSSRNSSSSQEESTSSQKSSSKLSVNSSVSFIDKSKKKQENDKNLDEIASFWKQHYKEIKIQISYERSSKNGKYAKELEKELVIRGVLSSSISLKEITPRDVYGLGSYRSGESQFLPAKAWVEFTIKR